MSIETTKTVRRTNALIMLREIINLKYFNEAISNEALEQALYEHSENLFENYSIVDDEYEMHSYDKEKTDWDDN